MMTTVENIKKLEKECTNLCDESEQIWTNMIEYPTMKVVEYRLRDAQEKVQKDLERINTLPPTK
jgi:hypothetical protein